MRDWTQHFSHENGNYQNKCHECGQLFLGNKYILVCKHCATKKKTIDDSDYSKKENQIDCGYCIKETFCEIRDPKINKAKLGCKNWIHWKDFFNMVLEEE